MPNIVTAQPQVFYNITQTGTANTTGTTSSLEITPNDGYTIAASQFTCSGEEGVYTVAFQNTIEPYAAGNKVKAIVTWAAAVTLTEDVTYTLDINFDDTADSYSSTQTNLDFIIRKHEPDFDLTADFGTPAFDVLQVQSTGDIPLPVITVDGYHATLPTNASAFRVQKTMYGYEQTNIARISVTLLEAAYYFENNLTISIAADNALGTFEFIADQITYDNYNNLYVQGGYIAYTPNEDNEENDDVVITVYVSDRVKYYATILEGQGSYTAISHEEEQINFLTNIPTSTWFFSFAETWANVGETSSTNNSAYIDITAVPDGANRSQVITLKDTVYESVNRATLTLSQTIEPTIDLYIQTSPPGEYVISDDPVEITSSSAAKVISTPNADENVFEFLFNQGQQQYYDNQLDTSSLVEYCLYAQISTPGSPITAEQLNTDDTLLIQNSLYPVDLSFEPYEGYQETSFVHLDLWNWELVSTGENNTSLLFKRKFYIRNQDRYGSDGSELTTLDRVATITLTHPEYPGVSDSVTITQDKRSANGENVKIKLSTDSSYPATTTTTDTVSSIVSSEPTYYVRMDDYENDFNLFNAITTDSEAFNYKQYPEMTHEVFPTGTMYGTSVDDLIVVSDDTWFSVNSFEYNSSYDASSSSNDHQYSLQLSTEINNSYSDRKVVLAFFHAENENASFVGNANGKITITQPALPKLNAFIHPINDDTYDAPDGTSAFVVEQGGDRNVYIFYNGNTPTIGVWTPPTDDTFGFYTPLAAGATYNGLSYSSPTTLLSNFNGGYAQNTVVSMAASNPGDPDKNITLGFWGLNSSPQEDEPTDTISFFQPGAYIDPLIYNTTCNVSGSSVQSGDTAGTVVFNVTVSDYSESDFPGDNLPVVELVATDGLNTVIDDTNNILSDTITIAANPLWNAADGNHTHTVTISHGALPDANQFFLDLRTRHQYIDEFPGGNATASVILTGAETMFFTSATAFTPPIFGETMSMNYVNTGSPKTFTLPSVADSLNLNIYTNLGGESEDEKAMLYHTPVDYITARFITSDDQTTLSTKVFKNGSIEDDNNQLYDIPHTFYLDGGTPESIQNSRHVIKSVTKVKSKWYYQDSTGQAGTVALADDINWVTYGAWPTTNYSLNFNIAPNTTGYNITSYIGIWTGNRSPKTNLASLSRPFFGSVSAPHGFNKNTISCQTGAGRMGDLMKDTYNGNASNTNVQNAAPDFLELTGSNELKFNQAPITMNGLNGLQTLDMFQPEQNYCLIALNILNPLDLTAETSTYAGDLEDGAFANSRRLFGVEYVIGDYESHPEADGQNTTFGISSGWWSSPVTQYEDSSSPTTSEISDSLKGSSNGTYRGKIRVSGGINNFLFFARANTKLTIKSFKIWEIDNDKGLQPDRSTVTNLDGSTNNRPNDIIKIIQLPVFPALNFSDSGASGTPVSDNPALGAIVHPDSTFLSVSINKAAALYAINLVEYEGENPVLKIWDGTNSSDITSASWTWGGFSPQGGGTGYDEDAGIFIFGVEENNYVSPITFIGEARSITFGLYNYEPANSTQAPLATLTIVQLPNSLGGA